MDLTSPHAFWLLRNGIGDVPPLSRDRRCDVAVVGAANELKEDVGFRRRPSLYYASRSHDVEALRKESAARGRARLPCEVLEETAIRKLVDFNAPLALWSSAGGEVDPWRLTHALLKRRACPSAQSRRK